MCLAMLMLNVGICIAASPALPTGYETRLLLLDADTFSQRLVAVGERGTILLSDDDAQHWRRASSPGESLLTALTTRGRVAWAVGHDATILKSTDQAATWRRVHYAPEQQRPLLDVLFMDDSHGFAVGAYGAFLETRDGGEHWTSRNIAADDHHLNAIALLANGTLLIAGEAGTLLRSTDAGQTWQTLISPYAGSWFGVLPVSRLPVSQTGALVFGLRGKIFRSEDAGTSWQAVSSHTEATLMGGRVLNDGTTILAGHDGVMLTSTDQAHTFSLQQQPGNAAFSTVVAGKRSWWLVGERGITHASRSPQ